MKIQDIIDKFDEIDDYEFDTESQGLLTVRNTFKQFLQDNFTLMLDEIRKEAIEQSTGGADRYEIPYITIGKLLSIINSHKTL